MRTRPPLLLAALVMTCSAGAEANGRFPTANQLCFQPGNPSTIVMRSTFGLLVSTDSGQNWDWVCEQATGGVNSYDPPIAVFGDGTAIVGLVTGLLVSTDGYCNFNAAPGPVGSLVVADVVVRADVPNVGYVVTSTAETVPEAGSDTGASGLAYDNRVFVSQDNGGTYSQVGAPLDSDIFVETIEVAASDDSRLYASGSLSAADPPVGVFLSSDDTGQTWTRTTIPLTATEYAPYIAAVDPSVPGRVYVRTDDPINFLSRLLVTDDSGQTFREVYSGDELTAFALSTDGSQIFMGGADEGLLVANSTDLQFSSLWNNDTESATVNGNRVYVTSSEAIGSLLQVSDDGGSEFQSMVNLWTVRGPLACPAADGVAVCAGQWAGLVNTYGQAPATPVSDDAGTVAEVELTDAGSPVGHGVTSHGCAMVPLLRGEETRIVIAGMMFWMALSTRQRHTMSRSVRR